MQRSHQSHSYIYERLCSVIPPLPLKISLNCYTHYLALSDCNGHKIHLERTVGLSVSVDHYSKCANLSFLSLKLRGGNDAISDCVEQPLQASSLKRGQKASISGRRRPLTAAAISSRRVRRRSPRLQISIRSLPRYRWIG